MSGLDQYMEKWRDFAVRNRGELRFTAPLGANVIIYRADVDLGVKFLPEDIEDEEKVYRKLEESVDQASDKKKKVAA